jgi:hypothetical protein
VREKDPQPGEERSTSEHQEDGKVEKQLSKDHIQLVTFKAKMRLPLILS